MAAQVVKAGEHRPFRSDHLKSPVHPAISPPTRWQGSQTAAGLSHIPGQAMKSAIDTYADWTDEPFERPEMYVSTPERFIHPVGFIDFRFKHMKAENGRNEKLRHCQIRTVKLK